MNPIFHLAAQSRTGTDHAANEDACLTAPARGIVALADGVGGNQGGAEAARLALAAVAQAGLRVTPEAGLAAANRAVREAAARNPTLHGIGCALLVVAWDGARLSLAHAGDVRAYLLREGNPHQLTHDHSTAAEMARRGHITPEAARTHTLRHRLMRAVGKKDTIEPEIVEVSDLALGDRLLLCTDGLWSALPDAELGRLLEQGYEPQAIAAQLITASIEAGARDDLSAVVLLVEGVEPRLHAALSPRYSLRACLGRSACATVYGGVDTQLGREVAVKMLYPDTLNDKTRRRFRREAQVLARLEHPHIVPVYDAQLEGETPYLIMQYVSGETLRAHLDRGPFTVAEAVDLARQMAEGLAAAHRKDIIHRDLKPANVLLTPEDQLKLVDFGLARVPACFDEQGPLTAEGQRLGSPAYESPEQRRGASVDARSDLYALGAILYEMLTGERVSESANQQKSQPRKPSATNADAPSDLDAVVLKLLAYAPEDRYQSAEELLAALDARDVLPEPSSAREAPDFSALPPHVKPPDESPMQESDAEPPPDAGLAVIQQKLRLLLARATEESIALNHYYLGVEHFFLALLHSPYGDAAARLQRWGVTAEAIEAAILDYVGCGTGAFAADIPLTPRARRVLVLADDLASHTHEPLDEKHVWQAILEEGDGIPVRIIKQMGEKARKRESERQPQIAPNQQIGESANQQRDPYSLSSPKIRLQNICAIDINFSHLNKLNSYFSNKETAYWLSELISG